MRRHARPGGGRQVEVTIEGLGGRGDGVATWQGSPVFVAQTVVGDRLKVKLTSEKAGGWRGEPVELIEEGPGRQDPVCGHFGPCGACQLQQLDDGLYAEWKRGLVLDALARQQLEAAEVAPLVRVPPCSRRRASLAALRLGRRALLGFHERMSHRVVDLSECHVLRPEIFALLAPLRELLAVLLRDGESGEVMVTLTENGCDLLLTLPRAPDLAGRQAATAFAEAQDVARLSAQAKGETEPEPLCLRRPPLLTFRAPGKDVPVTPPPGGFVQPSAEGEAALRDAVLGALPEALGRVADLFCGCGTFSFALLAKASGVLAVEGDEPSLAALWTAARHGGLAGPLDIASRDLARQPLRPEELAGFDAVVFDPPRAGAREQAQHLAASAVPRIVAVSCNPVSFARDARILVEGGYRLERIVPVDQFPWTAHLELVAGFRRP
ncbi:23S rRNA m(5)U-1939 methyltransferase [Tistlia consotensis]|uniref:23S rRNA m(5)U-1939 methyltransferase n=1 Tax=Tistlia consotensis USBA 355 TaxID=560819 RepID=A0A1Y6CGJ1_9PROT|nr:class I SAM-dependent RNA methyltransferase [Tistlia consotensis]SMF60761.1 23S rRNA m(5)U-1939 methyltransferase [Tistlia consotensis USBA 355]SNR92816.1 23S rRNA m(5)U-1939 methyltransferase [Tistlia consotensis]